MKSIASAGASAAGEAIDEGKVLRNQFKRILSSEIDLWMVIDSRNFYMTLSSCRLASGHTIRSDVSSIRFEFFTKVVSKVILIPSSTNVADCGTKDGIPLTNDMQIKIVSESISIEFEDAIFQSSSQFTG